MARVTESGEWYIVGLNGDDIATFGVRVDANIYVMMLVEHELAESAILADGTQITR